MSEIKPDFETVKQALLQNPAQLATAVTDALLEAGTLDDWDSETIENVLHALQRYTLDVVGLPNVGDTGQDDKALKFWCGVADSAGIGRPSYEFDEEN